MQYSDFGYGGWLINSSEVIHNNFKNTQSAHVFHQKTNGSEKKKTTLPCWG